MLVPKRHVPNARVETRVPGARTKRHAENARDDRVHSLMYAKNPKSVSTEGEKEKENRKQAQRKKSSFQTLSLFFR